MTRIQRALLCRRDVTVDLLDDRFELSLDLRVGEAQNTVALSVEPAGTLLVVPLLLAVLVTIHFDDQSILEADKVDDVAAKNVLAAKPAPKSSSAQSLPEDSFVGSHLATQPTGPHLHHGSRRLF